MGFLNLVSQHISQAKELVLFISLIIWIIGTYHGLKLKAEKRRSWKTDQLDGAIDWLGGRRGQEDSVRFFEEIRRCRTFEECLGASIRPHEIEPLVKLFETRVASIDEIAKAWPNREVSVINGEKMIVFKLSIFDRIQFFFMNFFGSLLIICGFFLIWFSAVNWSVEVFVSGALISTAPFVFLWSMTPVIHARAISKRIAKVEEQGKSRVI